MALVRIDDIGHGNVARLHRIHDLLGLGDIDPGVVGTLPNQQRNLDLVGEIKRRTLLQQRQSLGGIGIAHPLVELDLARLPIRRDGLQQGFEVRRPDDIDSAGKLVGGHRHPGKRCIAAIASTHDRDLVRSGHALLHRPVGRIQQVVVHLAAPLQVRGGDEVLPEARRAAEIDRKHGIAAVGHQLMGAVEAKVIARPRAAMNQQYHRHRTVGLAILVAVRAGRKRQIGRQRKPVA